MTPKPFLRKPDIAHILRAAAGITGETEFTLVGTGAAIAQAKSLPLDMMRTRELDLQLPDDARGQRIADLIDGSIGEGSQFDATFGYYAHALPEGTAVLPADWTARARRFAVPQANDLRFVCPDMNDLALSKLAAWREKDVDWLRKAVMNQAVDPAAMRQLLASMATTTALQDTMRQRLDHIVPTRNAAPTRSSVARPTDTGWER